MYWLLELTSRKMRVWAQSWTSEDDSVCSLPSKRFQKSWQFVRPVCHDCYPPTVEGMNNSGSPQTRQSHMSMIYKLICSNTGVKIQLIVPTAKSAVCQVILLFSVELISVCTSLQHAVTSPSQLQQRNIQASILHNVEWRWQLPASADWHIDGSCPVMDWIPMITRGIQNLASCADNAPKEHSLSGYGTVCLAQAGVLYGSLKWQLVRKGPQVYKSACVHMSEFGSLTNHPIDAHCLCHVYQIVVIVSKCSFGCTACLPCWMPLYVIS